MAADNRDLSPALPEQRTGTVAREIDMAKRNALLRVGGQVLRDAREQATIELNWRVTGKPKMRVPPKHYKYTEELAHLQFELIKLQEWVRMHGLKVLVIFEGRDAAGKGGVIKRIAAPLNPRVCRIVALQKPTERERGEWYFQRYVGHLPAKGEIVLFDRSWYNRAGVEHVMGFCTKDEYKEFLRACPLFEEMLIRSGIHLVKYWFSVSDKQQELRFHERMRNPFKRWKLSPMDLEARKYWVEFSKAKDQMFVHTDTKKSPWYVVDADNKKRARLNCIRHLLQQIPYKDLTPIEFPLPSRQPKMRYKRPRKSLQRFVPKAY